MKRLLVAVLVAVFVCLTVTAVQPQNRRFKVEDKTSPVWQELETYYEKSARAIINKDLETTLKLRELLTIESPDGRIREGEEVTESTKAQFKLNQNVLKISNKILSLTTEGNEAVAIVEQRVFQNAGAGRSASPR